MHKIKPKSVINTSMIYRITRPNLVPSGMLKLALSSALKAALIPCGIMPHALLDGVHGCSLADLCSG